MERALFGCILLSLSCGPLGVFLVLRRMILVGDALSHGLLPGMAVGFLIGGYSIWALSIGGIVAGITIGIASTFAARREWLAEDSALAGFYLFSMALGVTFLSHYNHHIDLLHVLFGSVLAISSDSLLLMSISCIATLLFCGIWYHALVIECFDGHFFHGMGGKKSLMRMIFLGMLTINLVAAFQAFGAMMSLGLLVLPALTMRLMSQRLLVMCCGASLIGILGSFGGLFISYVWGCASGPSIIVILGIIYIVTFLWREIRITTRKKYAITSHKMLCILFVFLGAHDAITAKKPLKIMVTSSILQDWVQQIGGEHVEVTSFIGSQGDLHDYHPSPQDRITVERADIIFLHGLGFDKWITPLLTASKSSQRAVTVTSSLQHHHLIYKNNEPDPHVWHDVSLARICLHTIKEHLMRHLPQHKQELEKRFAAYDKKLATLHQWILTSMGPFADTKIMVLGHDAFRYYSKAYSIDIHGVFSHAMDGMAPKNFIELIEHAGGGKFSGVFVSHGVRIDFAETLAHDMGVPFGGLLYADTLLPPNISTYEELLVYNTTTLVKILSHNFSSMPGTSQKKIPHVL